MTKKRPHIYTHENFKYPAYSPTPLFIPSLSFFLSFMSQHTTAMAYRPEDQNTATATAATGPNHMMSYGLLHPPLLSSTSSPTANPPPSQHHPPPPSSWNMDPSIAATGGAPTPTTPTTTTATTTSSSSSTTTKPANPNGSSSSTSNTSLNVAGADPNKQYHAEWGVMKEQDFHPLTLKHQRDLENHYQTGNVIADFYFWQANLGGYCMADMVQSKFYKGMRTCLLYVCTYTGGKR